MEGALSLGLADFSGDVDIPSWLGSLLGIFEIMR